MPKDTTAGPDPDDGPWRFAGFAIPTTTPVPDQLFDELMPRLSPAELVVTLYIVRRTFGFKKPSDRISLRQLTTGIVTRDGRVLDGGTGLSKATVARALNSLAAKGVIVREHNRSSQHGDEPTTYQLNFLGTVSHIATPSVSHDETGPIAPVRHPVSHQRDTQQTVEQQTERQQTDLRSSNSKRLKPRIAETVIADTDEPITTERDASATASSKTARGLAAMRQVLVERGLAGTEADAIPRPSRRGVHDGEATLPRAGDLLDGPEEAPLSDEELDRLRAELAEVADELGDSAPAQSTLTRVVGYYRSVDLDIDSFTRCLHVAHARTKDDLRTGRVRERDKAFAYFLSLLKQESEQRARQGVGKKRRSLAGRYARYVRR
jgi:hypothetical protein